MKKIKVFDSNYIMEELTLLGKVLLTYIRGDRNPELVLELHGRHIARDSGKGPHTEDAALVSDMVRDLANTVRAMVRPGLNPLAAVEAFERQYADIIDIPRVATAEDMARDHAKAEAERIRRANSPAPAREQILKEDAEHPASPPPLLRDLDKELEAEFAPTTVEEQRENLTEHAKKRAAVPTPLKKLVDMAMNGEQKMEGPPVAKSIMMGATRMELMTDKDLDIAKIDDGRLVVLLGDFPDGRVASVQLVKELARIRDEEIEDAQNYDKMVVGNYHVTVETTEHQFEPMAAFRREFRFADYDQYVTFARMLDGLRAIYPDTFYPDHYGEHDLFYKMPFSLAILWGITGPFRVDQCVTRDQPEEPKPVKPESGEEKLESYLDRIEKKAWLQLRGVLDNFDSLTQTEDDVSQLEAATRKYDLVKKACELLGEIDG